MKSSYRISPIGKKGSQYPSCWEMPVKSWIVSPLKSAKSGNVVVSGVAMGGTKKVSNIKVSVDGGKSWKKAKFTGPDMGKVCFGEDLCLKLNLNQVAIKSSVKLLLEESLNQN